MLAAVGQLAVDLVGEHIQVVFNDDVRDRLEVFLAHDCPRGIVGVRQHQDLGLRRDRSLELFGFEAEFILILERNNDRHAVRQNRAGLIGDIGRLRDQYFVALVDHGAEHQVDGLRAADGNQYFAHGIIVDSLCSL